MTSTAKARCYQHVQKHTHVPKLKLGELEKWIRTVESYTNVMSIVSMQRAHDVEGKQGELIPQHCHMYFTQPTLHNVAVNIGIVTTSSATATYVGMIWLCEV